MHSFAVAVGRGQSDVVRRSHAVTCDTSTQPASLKHAWRGFAAQFCSVSHLDDHECNRDDAPPWAHNSNGRSIVTRHWLPAVAVFWNETQGPQEDRARGTVSVTAKRCDPCTSATRHAALPVRDWGRGLTNATTPRRGNTATTGRRTSDRCLRTFSLDGCRRRAHTFLASTITPAVKGSAFPDSTQRQDCRTDLANWAVRETVRAPRTKTRRCPHERAAFGGHRLVTGSPTHPADCSRHRLHRVWRYGSRGPIATMPPEGGKGGTVNGTWRGRRVRSKVPLVSTVRMFRRVRVV